MAKSRFLNQKLGKRTSRQVDLMKFKVGVQRAGRPGNSSRQRGRPQPQENSPGR